MRSRLSVAVLVAFLIFAALTLGVLSWYGFRVATELSAGSWRTPTQIIDRHGETFLELYGAEWRVTAPIILKDLPDHVSNAFLAAEDVRFRSHIGIDPVGVGRAALTNVKAGSVTQGGSTITQQLAKTHFLSAERTFTRKAIEATLALLIELRLSKDDILEAYLNDVYLGHRDGRSILGLDEAARVYFNKSPQSLTVAEAALLAGMIRAPNRDNPEDSARVARERRDAVLGVMLQRKWISADEHSRALARSVQFRPGPSAPTPHPYLVAALRSEISERSGSRRLRQGGLKIYTAVDPKMQRDAEAAVRGGVQRLRRRHSWLRRKAPLQAAILSVDPATGGIRALVGGSDFRKSQLDRTRRMRRQPGSAFKPFTYAAAIASRDITPATIVEDKPVRIQLARNDIWRPQNYDERFRGQVTVREAFEKSLNTPAVQIADRIGVKDVRHLLEKSGFAGKLSDTPAIALGVDDVSMRELVSAYTVFPNLGRRTEPHLVDRIENSSGRQLYRFKAKAKEVLDPAVAYIVHSLMRGVVQRGTASDLSDLGLAHIAGKTGTTNDYRDAWFVGYAPDLLTAAWAGFDDGKPLRISSAEAALPIWAAFMVKVPQERGELEPPTGVHRVGIEPSGGLLWQSGCGERLEEFFLEGTEPREHCQGRVEEPEIFIDYQDPPVISPEQSDAWATQIPGLDQVQIILDPGAGPPSAQDPEPGVLDEEERESIDRQLEEELKRAAEEPAPPTPPAVDPEEEDRKDSEKEERRREKDFEKEQKKLEKENKPD